MEIQYFTRISLQEYMHDSPEHSDKKGRLKFPLSEFSRFSLGGILTMNCAKSINSESAFCHRARFLFRSGFMWSALSVIID